MRALGVLSRGAVAGAVGTAVMTAAQAVEMRASGRPPSLVPGEVAAKLLRRRGRGEVERLLLPMHWAHGVANGALRGLMGRAGLHGPSASALHFAALWSSDIVLYQALGVAAPPWRWTFGELYPDVLHKAIYCAATGAAYDRLAR